MKALIFSLLVLVSLPLMAEEGENGYWAEATDEIAFESLCDLEITGVYCSQVSMSWFYADGDDGENTPLIISFEEDGKNCSRAEAFAAKFKKVKGEIKGSCDKKSAPRLRLYNMGRVTPTKTYSPMWFGFNPEIVL